MAPYAAAQAAKEAGPDAAVGAGTVPAIRGVAGNAVLPVLLLELDTTVEDVAGTTTSDMADRGSLLAGHGEGILLLDGQSATLNGGVDVARSAAARVEAAGGEGLGWGELSDGAGGGGCRRSTEEVACTAAAGVSVGVLDDGGVRLVDVVSHGCCLGCTGLGSG